MAIDLGNSSGMPPTSSDANTNHTSPTFLAMPAEVLLEIFSYLTPIYSVSLGLTCRYLYTTHRDLHPSPVLLTSRGLRIREVHYNFTKPQHIQPFTESVELSLDMLLRDWNARSGSLVWGGEYDVYRFITPARLEERKRFISDTKKVIADVNAGIQDMEIFIQRAMDLMHDGQRLVERIHPRSPRNVRLEQKQVQADCWKLSKARALLADLRKKLRSHERTLIGFEIAKGAERLEKLKMKKLGMLEQFDPEEAWRRRIKRNMSEAEKNDFYFSDNANYLGGLFVTNL
jgi:hypothetical protein